MVWQALFYSRTGRSRQDGRQGNCRRKRRSLAWKKRMSSMPYLSLVTHAKISLGAVI